MSAAFAAHLLPLALRLALALLGALPPLPAPAHGGHHAAACARLVCCYGYCRFRCCE